MDKENKAVELNEKELAQVIGGNKQMSYDAAFHLYCSSFKATESARLACDEMRCRSCVYFLITDNNYYCTKDKSPTMRPQ